MSDQHLKIVNYSDLLLKLCDSVTGVLTSATGDNISYAPMIQTITKTTLTPDIGTFAMFTGSFSGMAVINFPKETAMEIYKSYMTMVGIPEKEQAHNYTSEEVSNALGELMNQILGNYVTTVSRELHTKISQSQPKMLALPKELQINISVNLDTPKFSKVTFFTERGNVFFMELAMDNVEFCKLRDIEEHKEESPDDILKQFNL